MTSKPCPACSSLHRFGFGARRRRAFGALARHLLLSLILWPQLASAQQLTVSDSGTPAYRIPIELPPGIAGQVPTVGLAHSAAGVDGPVGYGWVIEGTSAIARCPNIKAIDGATLAGLTNTASDKLCLDGQRLIQTDSAGTVSATQSNDSLGLGQTPPFREFRTEKDSFARIRAYGAAGGDTANGPAYFKVWTKAGQVLEYGTASNGSANATITPQGSSVATTWALSRSSDVLGNYIDYQYDVRSVAWGTGPAAGPTSGREWNLSEVRYTGTASSAPANRVSFVYANRPANAATGKAYQRAELFHLGAKAVSVRRLSKIQTYINIGGASPVKVKTYSITYDNSSTSSRSRIQQVTECVGAAESPCLPSTRFEYSAGVDESYTSSSLFAGSTLANLKLPAAEDEVMPSLNRESAIGLARQRIDQLAQAAGDEFEILSDSTMEIEQGWVFFFNTTDFVRTRNPASALAGNGPLFVTREGIVHELPSAIPWEDAVRQL